jgi:hypothetical protein
MNNHHSHRNHLSRRNHRSRRSHRFPPVPAFKSCAPYRNASERMLSGMNSTSLRLPWLPQIAPILLHRQVPALRQALAGMPL